MTLTVTQDCKIMMPKTLCRFFDHLVHMGLRSFKVCANKDRKFAT